MLHRCCAKCFIWIMLLIFTVSLWDRYYCKRALLCGWIRKRHPVFWADTWVVKFDQLSPPPTPLAGCPMQAQLWQPQAEAHSEPCTFLKPTFCTAALICKTSTCSMHSLLWRKLLACAESSICSVPLIRSNTQETGLRYQWKCFTKNSVVNFEFYRC